ncbi:hypothetical protein [Phytohabitans rumicis]|uniref:Uncharacterized protein n=1 Tax=Phytohabitans rumicis TaxID=1076125 RepID=A0A6V8KPS9_9ACTN|nr:hypothetical protein [Phytohabitans rumicis]GFJ87172.1 hypothetical protein Prum_008140 [Phytohabitans rumicis]
MTQPYVHHPRFAVTARSGLSRGAALTFQDGVELGPALLVPVDVQAQVVRPGDTVEHADIRVRLFDQAPGGGRPRMPDPFTSHPAGRQQGVRLHWALPDGLTRARTTGPDGQPHWRPLPDRWMVLRLLPGVGTDDRRPVAGWVIESERRRATVLDTWQPGPPDLTAPPPATPQLDPADLHAMLGGDPAWAAVFDNVEDRFAFYDEWKDEPSPPAGYVAYLVVGWYSTPALDPLAGLDTADGFHARLAELGWSVDSDRLAALHRAAEATAAKARAVGLDARTPTVAPVTDFSGLVPAATPEPRPWWPRRSVFHGVIYGVRADAPLPDRRPAPGQVRVGLGPTAEQSLAALTAGVLGDPDVELLQAAFQHALADTLGEPDGLAQVEAELHSAGFDAKPGEDRVERVLSGDPFSAVRPPPATPATTALLASHPDRTVRFAFTADGSRVADLHTAEHTPGRAVTSPEPRAAREVRRPGPRWFAPRDPSFVIRGLRRSLRHGYDGRFEAGETLPCRLTGDPGTRLLGFLDGRVLLQRGIGHGAVPDEAEALLVEAAIEDPFELYEGLLEQYASLFGHSQGALLTALRAESRVFRQWLAGTDDATPLLGISLRDGTGSAPAGITIWQQAWVPLYLEWELAVDPNAPDDAWPLGELDHEPPAGLLPDPARTVLFSGRSLLNSASARGLADRVRAFLSTEDELDLAGKGRIADDVAAKLRGLSVEAGQADLLTAGLDGLRERLLGYSTDIAYGGEPRQPSAPPRPTRAGLGRITRLRVVDAFGRTLTLVDNAAPAPYLARAIRADRPDQAGMAVLRPRINQPARLLLRLTDPIDDTREASVDQTPAPGGGSISPVAGWLLPDPADGAVELFDPDGAPLGQLAHDSLSGAVVWQEAPGGGGPVGSTPEARLAADPRLRHLLAFTHGLLYRDVAERASLHRGHTRSDTPLEALLRVIETTAATIGLGGQTGTEHVTQLVGRPVAIVRATLRLEVEPEPPIAGLSEADQNARDLAWAGLRARSFPVRLGALTRLDDGLLGYFTDDRYDRLYPVHDSVAALAVDIGRHRGDLRALGAAPVGPRPITSGYLAADPAVWLRPGQTVTLTLIQDPAAKVHATSGLLPRKAVSLVRDWTEAPLARLVPSLRIGPVLVDPAGIRMPLASALGAGQEWSRRDGPVTWRQDPITAATQQAMLPETAAIAQEGWVRVSADDQANG